jgi:UDP-N-acetylmuramate dehydrogenase
MEKILDLLPGIKKNIPLAPFTTFKIGGRAKYFYRAKTKEDLIFVLKLAKKLKLPFFVLGGGSNILVSDKGFNGLIIKNENSKFRIQNLKLYTEAGVSFSTLVKETTRRGLAGLEWAGGLPGSIGGAILGNAGAFGGETKDTVILVEALDKNLKIRKLKKKQCKFSYRSSVFKKRGWIVLSAIMKLRKGDRKNLQKIVHHHIRYRQERNPLEYPNAGSVFKNCDLKKVPKKVRKIFKEVVKVDPFPVIPTAAIIAKSGLLGKKIGKAKISEKHPNFIINLGGAKAEEVIKLINLVKKKVKEKFGIKLEEEIRYLGF